MTDDTARIAGLDSDIAAAEAKARQFDALAQMWRVRAAALAAKKAKTRAWQKAMSAFLFDGAPWPGGAP